MSESTEAAKPVASNNSRPTGVTIGIANAKSPGVSIGLGGEKRTGVSIGVGAEKNAGVSIGLGGDKSAGVSIGVGGEKNTGMPIAAGAEKSSGMAGSGKTTGISIGIGGEKKGGVSIGFGDEKSAGVSTSRGEQKSAGVSIGVGHEKPSVGVSIPDSVVAPLIGAGANVYIMTNELTQSMREKLGTSWPFVQDTLNSRYAKLLAGGLLASVAVIVVWKIIKRFSAKPKIPVNSEDESCQWTSTKTFEMQRQVLRAEGDHDDSYPLNMLPHKVQMRVTDTPLQTTRSAEPELCKARDAATRHRHTRHLDKCQGEQAAAECYSPWHSEQPHPSDPQCSCPTELCGSLAPKPRLLYSVKDSHMTQRDLPNTHLENLVTYASSPSALCPTMLESVCPHNMCCKAYCGSSHGHSACTAHLLPHQHVLHSPFTDVNLINTASQPPLGVLVPSCPSVQRLSPHHSLHNAGVSYFSAPQNELTRTTVSWPDEVSVQESRPMSSVSGITEITACQTLTTDNESKCLRVESKARSVSQQTDGHPVEEDLDMPGHVTDTHQTANPQAAHTHMLKTQKVPTRMAQSTVTPSQCTNTPIRTDNTQVHFSSSLSCPPQISSFNQTYHPTVYQTSQGAVVQLLPGGECPGFYHQHTLNLEAHNPSVLNDFSNTTQLQPLTYRQHVAVDQILPSSVQQKKVTVQSQQMQQQQPVVQHPSDSSVSQNSSEEAKQYEGCQPTSGCQETTPPEVQPQERMLVQQYIASAAGNSPGPALHHHHTSSLPALMDHAHADYPWRGPHALHNYKPIPVCTLGYQSPGSRHYAAWHNPCSPHGTTFLPPSVVLPSASVFMSTPAGMLASSSAGLLPSLQQERLMASHWPNACLYQQAPLPVLRHATVNPNYNLSNSNTHVLMQESGQNARHAVPFLQEHGKIRVIESDHSINSSQTCSTAVKAESPVMSNSEPLSNSETSIQTIGENTQEIPTRVEETADSAQRHTSENSLSCHKSQAELTAPAEEMSVSQADAVEPRQTDNTDTCQGEGTASQHTEVLQTEAPVICHFEEISDPPSSSNSSASSKEGETQL